MTKEEASRRFHLNRSRLSGLGDIDPLAMPPALIDLITRRNVTPAILEAAPTGTAEHAGVGDRGRCYAAAAFDGEIRAVETARPAPATAGSTRLH